MELLQEPRKTTIIHHIDNDGYMSGAILNFILNPYGNIVIHGNFNKDLLNTVTDFIPYNYGGVEQEIKIINSIGANEIVGMSDISFSPPSMIKLRDKLKSGGGELYWYDHHESAINESIENKYDDLPGIRTTTHSATRILHDECIRLASISDIRTNRLFRVPSTTFRMVDYIDAWDTWKFHHRKDSEQIKLFRMGIDYCINNPDSTLDGILVGTNTSNPEVPSIMFDLASDYYFHTAHSGGRDDCILKYIRYQNPGKYPNMFEKALTLGTVVYNTKRMYYKSVHKNAISRELDGVNFLMSNSPMHGSDQLEDIFDPNIHDVILRYYINSYNQVVYTAYKPVNSNLTKSILELNTGLSFHGHPGACGGSTDLETFIRIAKLTQ